MNNSFIQNMWKKISLNELAAKGITLSLRETMIGYINKMETATEESTKLL